MDILKAIILGIIQGLTEFLPISSSGHLVLAEEYINFDQPNISFEIILHLGSLLAVLVYFRKDIIELIASLFIYKKNERQNRANRNTLFYMIVVTTVTGLIGFYFKEFFTSTFSVTYYASTLLLVTGLILFISDKITPQGLKTHQLGIKKSIVIGLTQSLAIFPGISRSGTTIATGIFTGLKREEAARFSFLISIPAILGANISEIKSFMELEKIMLMNYIFGLIAAFIAGYSVIALLIKLVKKQKLRYFSYYCWFIGGITLIIYFFRS